MKDTVKLIAQGTSLRFTIVPAIHKELNLDFGNAIEIEIFKIIQKGKDPIEVSEYMTRKVIKIGGTSKGVSVKSIIVKRFSLEAGDEIGVNIKLKET